MIVISSSTFRSEQSKYLDMAGSGENVIVTRNNRPAVVIAPAINFEIVPKTDITSSIVNSLSEIKDMMDGKLPKKTARDFLNEI